VEEKCFVFSGMAFRAPSLFFSAFHFQKLFVFLWIDKNSDGKNSDFDVFEVFRICIIFVVFSLMKIMLQRDAF